MADNEIVPLEHELAASREDAFAEALSDGCDIVEATSVAAYAEGSSGRSASRREPVQKAVRGLVESKIKTEGIGLAYKAMKRLLTSGAPPAVQLGAAKWMMEAAGIGGGSKDDEPPVQEMTDAQLQRFIARAQRVVDMGGKAPVIRVTPDEGA